MLQQTLLNPMLHVGLTTHAEHIKYVPPSVHENIAHILNTTAKDGNPPPNAFLSEQNLPVATTCYLPFIRAPPTDLTTIYTILLRLVQIAEKLDQSHILVTADCAIYSKAQQILWNKPALLDGKVTMRLHSKNKWGSEGPLKVLQFVPNTGPYLVLRGTPVEGASKDPLAMVL